MKGHYLGLQEMIMPVERGYVNIMIQPDVELCDLRNCKSTRCHPEFVDEGR